jgi:hypothetical protein
MKKSEIRQYLESNFRVVLEGLKKRKYRFYKDFGELYFAFGLGIIDSDNSFPSTFNYGIGNLNYSNLLNFMIDNLDLNFQKDKYMTVFGSGQIRLFDEGKYPVLEYDICTEADAQKMVNEVSNYILTNVLPEWEANPTLEFLERKVNQKLSDSSNFFGLILAKLVRNPNYKIIKNHYENISREWSDGDKKNLEKIISFLDSHSHEELLKISETLLS